ncbi:hypothetical protein B0H16DRAFT_1810241 [Mycena metata]|uniref:Uncharacterized protein n=1 Tax=Mycena metata TaxID=1033252 RepID=A0AAD7MF52_9AGAR|nr:hypothetical protein B0H16DRAFT_1810241 [Mycena metata]
MEESRDQGGRGKIWKMDADAPSALFFCSRTGLQILATPAPSVPRRPLALALLPAAKVPDGHAEELCGESVKGDGSIWGVFGAWGCDLRAQRGQMRGGLAVYSATNNARNERKMTEKKGEVARTVTQRAKKSATEGTWWAGYAPEDIQERIGVRAEDAEEHVNAERGEARDQHATEGRRVNQNSTSLLDAALVWSSPQIADRSLFLGFIQRFRPVFLSSSCATRGLLLVGLCGQSPVLGIKRMFQPRAVSDQSESIASDAARLQPSLYLFRLVQRLVSGAAVDLHFAMQQLIPQLLNQLKLRNNPETALSGDRPSIPHQNYLGRMERTLTGCWHPARLHSIL